MGRVIMEPVTTEAAVATVAMAEEEAAEGGIGGITCKSLGRASKGVVLTGLLSRLIGLLGVFGIGVVWYFASDTCCSTTVDQQESLQEQRDNYKDSNYPMLPDRGPQVV